MTDTIVRTVSRFYKIKPKEMFKMTNKRHIKHPRQVTQYFIRKYSKKSMAEIGLVSLEYGRSRKHTHASVLNSYNRINDLLDTDKSFVNDYNIMDLSIKKALDLLSESEVDLLDEIKILKSYKGIIAVQNQTIQNLKNQITDIMGNNLENKDNFYIKQLLNLDPGTVHLFIETRVRPFLRMIDSDEKRLKKINNNKNNLSLNKKVVI